MADSSRKNQWYTSRVLSAKSPKEIREVLRGAFPPDSILFFDFDDDIVQGAGKIDQVI